MKKKSDADCFEPVPYVKVGSDSEIYAHYNARMKTYEKARAKLGFVVQLR